MAHAPLLVGNAQAFWGDDPGAPARLVRQRPDLDFLTLDYLAEVLLSIMAIEREEGPTGSYARDFIEVLRSLAPLWRDGSRVKIISNAGGLNSVARGRTCVAALAEIGLGRFEAPNLEAMNFLLEGVLGEAVDRSGLTPKAKRLATQSWK